MTRKPTTRAARLGRRAAAIAATPVLIALNIVVIAGLASGAWLGIQWATGTQAHGVVTDVGTGGYDRHGRDLACFAWFHESPSGQAHKVHLYAPSDGCYEHRGQRVTLVVGLLAPVFQGWIDASDGLPMEGLFGTSDGAVLSWWGMVRSMWSLAFLGLVAVLLDAGVVQKVRDRRRDTAE